jgi:hypothetical protein
MYVILLIILQNQIHGKMQLYMLENQLCDASHKTISPSNSAIHTISKDTGCSERHVSTPFRKDNRVSMVR